MFYSKIVYDCMLSNIHWFNPYPANVENMVSS